MAKKELTMEFTKDQKARFTALNKVIVTNTKAGREASAKMENSARNIAAALYEISEKNLYQIGGFKSIAAYAAEKHGMARSTVSEALKVYRAYHVKDGYALDSKYDAVPYAKLIDTAGLDEVVRERLDVFNPDIDRATVRERVKAYKVAEEKLAPNWTLDDVTDIAAEINTEASVQKAEQKVVKKVTISVKDLDGNLESAKQLLEKYWSEICLGDMEITLK